MLSVLKFLTFFITKFFIMGLRSSLVLHFPFYCLYVILAPEEIQEANSVSKMSVSLFEYYFRELPQKHKIKFAKTRAILRNKISSIQCPGFDNQVQTYTYMCQLKILEGNNALFLTVMWPNIPVPAKQNMTYYTQPSA